MILRILDLQEACKKILNAVDSDQTTSITDALEIVSDGNRISINVTNHEYYARVYLPCEVDEVFRATVNAKLFLSLVAQTTTDTVELTIADTNLKVKANGTYKLPLIFEGDDLLELPEIALNNVTANFKIESNILHSILKYNSKELLKGTISRPVQKLYYFDDKGAITFTTGACVNEFNLEKPIKILLNNKIVKLFKLFGEGNVDFSLGHDAISNEIVQTKVRFATNDIIITSILSCDDTLLNQFPAEKVRSRALSVYPYSVAINKDAIISTINRLLIFSTNKTGLKPRGRFEFGAEELVIYDANGENKESVYYTKETTPMNETYTTYLDLTDFKTTLETCTEQYLTLNFGNKEAIVVARGKVYNVVPEARI